MERPLRLSELNQLFEVWIENDVKCVWTEQWSEILDERKREQQEVKKAPISGYQSQRRPPKCILGHSHYDKVFSNTKIK